MHVNMWQNISMIPTNTCECSSTTIHLSRETESADRLAYLLKALAEPMRLRTVAVIVELGGADVCACEFPPRLGISQPTASHHLKRLTEAGLLKREQRGKWAYFSLVPERFDEVRSLLDLLQS